jgi:hypothetical protein
MASSGQGLGVVTTRGWLVLVAVGVLVMVGALAAHANSVAWVGVVTAAVGVVGLVGRSVFSR